MKILVIDDNEIHRNSAKAQLCNHDLTVLSTYDEAESIVKNPHPFEAVFTDLLLPASSYMQSSNKFVGQEMMVGLFLGLLAAKNGAKYVAVFTDKDHHHHPGAACFDAFNKKRCGFPVPFTVEGAKMILCNRWIRQFEKENLAKEAKWDEDEKKTVWAKDWSTLLDYITGVHKLYD